MVAGKVSRPRRNFENQSAGARFSGRRSRITAGRQVRRSFSPPIPLLAPWVSVVALAELLPSRGNREASPPRHAMNVGRDRLCRRPISSAQLH
jgi:hypothetical protein